MLRVHGVWMVSGFRWHEVSGPVFGSANISAKELLPIVVAQLRPSLEESSCGLSL